jgi:hypothetical protein
MGPFPFEGEEDADVINAGKPNYYYPTGSKLF